MNSIQFNPINLISLNFISSQISNNLKFFFPKFGNFDNYFHVSINSIKVHTHVHADILPRVFPTRNEKFIDDVEYNGNTEFLGDILFYFSRIYFIFFGQLFDQLL